VEREVGGERERVERNLKGSIGKSEEFERGLEDVGGWRCSREMSRGDDGAPRPN
jgi:hypothetical protein